MLGYSIVPVVEDAAQFAIIVSPKHNIVGAEVAVENVGIFPRMMMAYKLNRVELLSPESIEKGKHLHKTVFLKTVQKSWMDVTSCSCSKN